MDLHILETIECRCLTLRQWNQMLVDLIYPKKLGLSRDSSARSLPPHWTGKWTKKKAIVAEMDGINHQNMGHWGDDCFSNMIHDWHFSQGLKDDIWSVFSEMFCLPGWWSGSIAGPPRIHILSARIYHTSSCTTSCCFCTQTAPGGTSLGLLNGIIYHHLLADDHYSGNS